MFIKRVYIKNFRSIVEEQFFPKDMNIFVGYNDVGKSNFLKALNLFFNGQTDSGQEFRFDTDYCYFPKKGAKQAPEITIEIEFSPPSTYMGGRTIKRRKVFRRAGLKTDELLYSNGEEIGGRTKVRSWQQDLQYKYIPAIKSNEYFQNLLRDLHDTLSHTVEQKLKAAGTDFIDKIKTNTEDISKNLLKKVGIHSSIQLPSDLKELFSTLDFQTKSGNKDVSLRQRGDGIKIRHIPIILKFLAEQQNKNLTSGAVRVDTIWGFEEPENNLEMSKAFSLANEFLDYSSNIQQFITTHSPSLYSLGSQYPEHVNVYHVELDELTRSSKVRSVDATATSNLDSSMGLMPVITPYVHKKNEEVLGLQTKLANLEKELLDTNTPTLFLEGKTDQRIVKKAMHVLSAKSIGIVKLKHGGGHLWVVDMLKAWAHLQKNIKACGVFDNEPAAKKSKQDVDNYDKCKKCSNERLMKTCILGAPKHLHDLFKKGISIPISMEEMLPPFTWEYAENKGWLEERPDVRLIIPLLPLDQTVIDFLSSTGLNQSVIRYATRKVKLAFKEDFSLYACNLPDDKLVEAFQPLTDMINEIDTFFMN